MTTLREIVAEHPEWLDLEIVVYQSNGDYAFVGASGTVYVDDAMEPNPVVVFAGN